jgi:acyl-CoA synthetase (AMP-forming)/AMP-acid ligase II
MLGPSSWLYQAALKWPQKEAIFDEEVSLSFEALYQDAIGVGKWLISEGEVGQRVMIALPSGVSSTVLYFGVMLAGRVAVPVDPMLRPDQLESMRREIDPQWVFGPSDLKSLWKDQRLCLVNSYQDLRQWTSRGEWEKDLTPSKDEPSRLINIVYTSGTTGEPKGVMLTAANLEAVIRGIQKALPIHPENRIFTALSFSHTYGLSQLWLMAKGGASLGIIPDITKMASIKKFLLERHMDVIAGVPYHFVCLTRRGDREKYDKIRWVTVAGEAPSKVLIEKIKVSFPHAKVYVMYGTTEASTRLTTLPAENLEKKEGSMGISIEGVDLKILDENERELGPHQEGELMARGPNITPGYWKDEELTRRTIIDGWLHTGDIVKKDEDDYYHHIGRKDFIFKSGGEKIIPAAIEKVLREIEGVKDAAVIGIADLYRGNRICAILIKEEGASITQEEIISYCQNNLNRLWVPNEIIFVESLPKTSSGKIQYGLLKEKILEMKGKSHGTKN